MCIEDSAYNMFYGEKKMVLKRVKKKAKYCHNDHQNILSKLNSALKFKPCHIR